MPHSSPLRTSVMPSLDISKDDSDDVSVEMGKSVESENERGCTGCLSKSLGMKTDPSAQILTERYFQLVFQKYGVPFPQDEAMKTTAENGYSQAVPHMLFDVANLFNEARVRY